MIEPLILAHLIRDEEYTRRVLPFLKKEYFTSTPAQSLYDLIHGFVQSYKVSPTIDALKLSLEQASLSGGTYTDTSTLLKDVAAIARIDSGRLQWLVDQTEQFCKQRALYLAISESITLIDKDFESAAAVPGLLKDALSVGFRTHIGHDYFEDILSRYDLYHQEQTRIPFDLELFNKITAGGLIPKTLNVMVAGTGVGKSLFLCHVAAASVAQGKRVLYITMEMAEERIAQRIDANLLDVTMETLEQMPRRMYESAFEKLHQRQAFGKLIIKEYPTSGGNVGHFRVLLDELALKKQFVPDLLIVDYINICSSVRFKAGGQTNSYNYVKSIAEELRGLAVEYNLPCLTATQFNREGFDNSDPSLTNTSESFGLPQTADLQVALVTSEELERDGLLMVKQLKNRYANTSKYRRFTIKVDYSKMRLSNDEYQQYLSDPMPAPSSGESQFKPNIKKATRSSGGMRQTTTYMPNTTENFSRGGLRSSLKSGDAPKITF